MLRIEFQKLTGLKVDSETYKKIEQVYMACPQLDKQVFCRDWLKHKDSVIIEDLMECIREYEATLDKIVKADKCIRRTLKRIGDITTDMNCEIDKILNVDALLNLPKLNDLLKT